MTYEEMKKNLPKFNSLEEVRAYANKTLYTKEPQQQAPTVLKVVTPKQPTTPQIGAGDTTQLPKDYDMEEHLGTFSANKHLGDLQVQYNDAMNTYFKSQSSADLDKAQGILKEIEEFQKKNPNVNKGGLVSKDFAQYLPQLQGQMVAGAQGAVVGAGTGFGVGAGIGTVVPGAGTLAGGVAGAGYGAKAGYVLGVGTYSFNQMRGSAYASLLELGARSGLTVEEQKYFNEVAREIASDTAFWQSVVESGEAVLDLATMGGFSKLFTTGAKTATQMTVKKMLAEALKAYGINILSEGAEEGVQERIAIEKEKEYLNKIGKEYTGTKEQESARVKEAVEGGIKISTVSGGLNAGGSVAINTINNVQANNQTIQSTVSQQPNLPKDWKPSKQVATQSTNTEMTKLNKNDQVAENVQKEEMFFDAETNDLDITIESELESKISEEMDITDTDIDTVVENVVRNTYKQSEEALNDEDIAYDELLEYNNEIREKVETKLKELGFDRYDGYGHESGGYNISSKLYDAREQLIEYLNDNDIEYEESKSIYSGLFPSIYVKNSDGNVVLRIGNHKNSRGASQTYTNKDIVENTNKIIEDIKKAVSNDIRYEKMTKADKVDTNTKLDKQTDVYYMEYPNGDKVEIIKNPTEKQMEEMRKEARTKYAPSYLEEVKDEPLLRRTYDSAGNVYYWQSIDAVHDTIENFLKSKYPNYKFSQNQKWVYNDERYDAMPMTAQEKLEKWADNRQQVYKDLAKEFGKGAMFWEANMDYYTQEQAINFVSREWNVVKKFAEQNNIEIEETYNFEKRIRESKEFQEYIKNIVAPLYAEKPKLTSEELTELAQDEFGTTNDFTFGAFMTPDGKMLDFEEDGYRNDHNGIRSINYNVNEFVSAGNIRIKPEGNGFELSVEPTSEQYETLAKYIDDYLQGQNIFVDITNEKGSPIAGRSYAENTPSSKIFNDIKEYFRTGEYPEKSELDDFRYDMMPEQPKDIYRYNQNFAGKGHSLYSDYEMRQIIKANDISVIDNQKKFIRTVAQREKEYGLKKWAGRMSDLIIAGSKRDREEAIRSYLKAQNSVRMDNEGRELSALQTMFFENVSKEMVDDNNRLVRLYHETNEENEFNEFNLDIKRHSDGDYQMPIGVFMKDTKSSIGIDKNTKNMELYANITNPLVVNERTDLEQFLVQNDKYHELVVKYKQIDQEYQKKYDELHKKFRKLWGDSYEATDPKEKQRLKEQAQDVITNQIGDNFFEEWRKEKNQYGNEARKVATEYLKELGYDGVIVRRDEGSFGRSVKTYIAFNVNQVKRIDNLNPSDSNDIRYDIIPVKDGFYSQLESTIINKMQKQAKASDVMNLILKNGVKQDEIAWTGIDDFLAGKDTVTKEEVLEYIRANQINIEEVVFDGGAYQELQKEKEDLYYRWEIVENKIDKIIEKYQISDYQGRGTLGYPKYIEDLVNKYDSKISVEDKQELVSLISEYRDIENRVEEIQGEMDSIDEPKYSKYATHFDGGKNYKEILFTIPEQKNITSYYSPHWPQRNILAHARTQEYETMSGQKVLFVEEIQSDLHQEGRRGGYSSSNDEINIKNKIEELQKIYKKLEEEKTKEPKYQELQKIRELYDNNVKETEAIVDRFNEKYNYEGIWDGLYGYITRLYDYSETAPEKTEFAAKLIAKNILADQERMRVSNLSATIREKLEKTDMNYDDIALELLGKDKMLNIIEDYRNARKKRRELYDERTELRRKTEDAKKAYFQTEIFKQISDNAEEIRTLRYELENIEGRPNPSEKFPFKKNWHEFVLRRLINEAVQNGYDAVAWTTGKQQNDRYDLSNYISELRYVRDEDGTYELHADDLKTGRTVDIGVKSANELESVVGKEVAEKILSGEYDTEAHTFNWGVTRVRGVLSDLDLEVGGEGMKGFYDKIIPEYLNKYLKKWNSKVEKVLIPDFGGEVHVQEGFTITPEMREAVKATGQPLYDSEIDNMSRKNIINKITETFGVERFANSNKELNEIASNIKNRIKARTITVKEMRDIVRDLGERLQVTTDKYNGQYDALKDELRTTKIYVSDSVKKGFGDWNDFRKSNFGTLKLTNDSKAMNVGEMYTYLQDKYGEDMFPGNITNESDQLEKIADVASDIKKYNISIEEYSRNMYGAEGWAEIQQMLVDEIKAIRTEYDLENPMDRSKQARVADKKTKEILKSIGITEEEIYDPANAFVQNLLETIEKDKEYFSRTLHEIEEGNLIFGDKRTNNILNKRRYDVQNGIVKANPKYSEGASLSAMRKEIENYLGRKIGLGGFRQRAYGIYKPSLDTIRIKDISNMETAIHELGHRVDYKELKSSLKGRSAKELDKLAERAFATMYDKQEDRKLEEGWAEFTKRFVVDNQTTLKEYPELSAYMLEELEKNKNMKKVIENLVELAEQYVNAPTEKQIRKMQSIGENTDKRAERNLFDKFMYEVYDDLWDIKQMTREFAKGKNQTFWTINPEDNIYNLMRTLRANEDRVLNVMKYGLIDDAGFKRTRGMSEIVEKLGDNPEKIQKVRDLMVALRTLDYTAVKLDTGLSTEEALKLIANYSKEKDILDTANGIMQFQEEIMKYAVEKGLMKKDDYEEMKKWNKFYIPLKRVYDGKVNSSTGGKGASKLTKQRTGSMRDIIDPLESIIQNTSMILTKINQNEIMKTLARLQEQTGIADYFEIVPPPQKLKAEIDLNLFKNILEEQGVDTDELDLDVVQRIFNPVMNDDAKMIMGYMDNGVLKAMEFKDRNIYDVMSKTNNSADMGAFIEAVERFTGLLRMGATTGNIEFALPNVISDTMTAWLFSESNFIPAVDSIRGVLDYMIANYSWADKVVKSTEYKQKNKYIYDLYKQSGATMATRVASYRPEVQEYVLEVFGKHANDLLSDDKTKSKNAGKAILNALAKSPQKIQDFLSILPELSEQGTRFESFKKDYIHFREQGHNHKNALLKASANTRDITMDFNRMGHSMRYYNRIRAFSGARTQGIYRFIEGIQKMPKKVTTKLGIMVGISLAIVAMAKRSGNKKEEEITDQVRKDNFIIPLGKDGEVLTIKKPQGAVRSVINFAEMMYNVASGVTKEEDYDKVWRNWVKDTVEENAPIELDLKEGNDFFSIISSAVLPTASEPIIENALNRDFYYGNPIIPYGKEDLKPEDQYDENTSQTAILLGKVLKQSPAKIENAITGWFAGVGQQALDLSDTVLGKVSDNIPEQPEKEKNSQMILRRFFANSYKNSNSVSEIYDSVEKLEQLKAYDDITPTEEQQLKKLNIAKKTMQLVNKDIKATRNSLKLNAEQKKNQINELQTLRTDTARYYLGKELINPSNAEKIELYEYWPASTTYKYKVNSMKTVEVEFTEADQKEYAQIARDEYNKLLSTEEKKRSYKEKNEKEKLETRESLLTKAKNTAKDTVAEKVYKRSR